MTKTILAAVRRQAREALSSMLEKSTHKFIIVDSLSEALVYLSEAQFQIAVIDEDFDGPNTGWTLAGSIRQYLASNVKIIVLASGPPQKYYDSKDFKGKFDWVMSFPIGEEQLLHELDRNELIAPS